MCFGAGTRLAVLLCACLTVGGLAACGQGNDDEVTLGAETKPSRVEQNEEKIRELERRLARRERREQRTTEEAMSDAGASGAGILSTGADSSFETLANTLGGEVGVAVGAVGSDDSQQLGPLQSGPAWSTIKLPIAARVIEDAGSPSAVSADTRDLIRRAITASDNAAAAFLWEQLGSQHGGPSGAAIAVGELLAAAGDTTTAVSTVGRDGFSPYGQTEWSLNSQERFMSSLAAGCVAPAASGELQALMGQVVPDQRWGLGATGLASYFKGGWGPGSDGRYLVRQVGVVEQDGGSIAVALAAIPSDGQFATGTAAVSQLAEWVVGNTTWNKAAPQAC
jgi:hypothetical protein